MTTYAANYALLDLFLYLREAITLRNHPRDRSNLLPTHMVKFKKDRIVLVTVRLATTLFLEKGEDSDSVFVPSKTTPLDRLLFILSVGIIRFPPHLTTRFADGLKTICTLGVLIE